MLRSSVGRPNALWLGFSAFAIASAMFIALNVPGSHDLAPMFGRSDTNVYRKAQDRPQDRFSFTERWAQAGDEGPMGPAAYEEPEYTGSVGFTKTVRTVAFTKPGGYQLASAGGYQLASIDPTSTGRSFPSVMPEARERAERLRQEMMSDPAAQKALASMDEVERYLWEVYTRSPIKKDGAGDFTWKDPAAAKRMGMALPTYVISGMDPDFREQLYHAGRAMDAAGVRWAILSAFRDDYRQRLASGFKASPRNSLHGGSARVGGYGHGRAVDVTSLEDDPEDVWHWIDRHGAKYGLSRPMPGADPAHIQGRGDWRTLAHALKRDRIKTAEANGGTEETKAAKVKRVANAAK